MAVHDAGKLGKHQHEKRGEDAGREVKRATLADILCILQPDDRACILHRLGPQFLETVAEGTARELRTTRCVEACGNNAVESITADVIGWPDAATPVLIVTIDGKEMEP